MRNGVGKTTGIRFYGEARVYILAVLLCLQFSVPYAGAQEASVLSYKPFITQIFRLERNETEVKVFLTTKGYSDPVEIPFGKDKSNPLRIYAPVESDARRPLQSGLMLDHASYVYEGKTPGGRQGVRFTFLLKRKDVFKDQPAFSISIEGQSIQEGMAEALVQLDSGEDFEQKVTLSVPTDVFLRVARAKKVLFKLGPKAYKPESFQQKSMRTLAGIIDPQGK